MDNHHDPFESFIIVYVFVYFLMNVYFCNIDGLLLEDILKTKILLVILFLTLIDCS